MGMVKRLDATGDSTVIEWDVADPESVEKARSTFDQLVADPMVGLAQIEDATRNIARKVTAFDPDAEQYIMWKQVVGG